VITKKIEEKEKVRVLKSNVTAVLVVKAMLSLNHGSDFSLLPFSNAIKDISMNIILPYRNFVCDRQ